MRRLIVLASLSAVILGGARGEVKTPAEDAVPLRRLCLDATAVVLAVPIDPVTPTRFRVLAALRGPLKADETVAPAGLDPELVRSFEDPDLAQKKPRPRRVTQALLFLEPYGKGWKVPPGGVRMCGGDGKTVGPSGPRGAMEARPGMRWSVVVNRVRDDLAALEQLNAYRRIGRPSRRAEALMGWVQARKAEFTATPPGTDESPAGWDRLQLDVFDWIFAAATPESAWRAVGLYAELNQGETPRLSTPVFSAPEGRALLVRIASDPKRLLGERTRALRLLGARPTLWPSAAEFDRGARAMEKKEQEALLEQVAKLLPEKDDHFRVWLAQTVVSLSQSVEGKLQKALPSLMRAYRESQPGPGRDELAMTLCALTPAEQWKELTGNPAGYCACLRDLSRAQTTVTFWLSLKTPGPAVFEPPTLVVEKLGTLGFVAETKRSPVEPKNLTTGWAAGWDGDDSLVVQLDVSKLAPGSIYRVKVEGFAGKGKGRVKWTSEPRKFLLPNRPPNQNQGGPYSKW
jgi:hypothetical protein